MITAVLSGVAAKLAGLTVAAKAGIGIGVATAAIGTASVVGVVPVSGVETGGSRSAAAAQLPSVPTAEADLGLHTANDAISAPAAQPDATGLDRAAQTPAAAHLPSVVPAPPANTGGATTGLDRAAQTPAAEHLPAFVPGPPASVSALLQGLIASLTKGPIQQLPSPAVLTR